MMLKDGWYSFQDAMRFFNLTNGTFSYRKRKFKLTCKEIDGKQEKFIYIDQRTRNVFNPNLQWSWVYKFWYDTPIVFATHPENAKKYYKKRLKTEHYQAIKNKSKIKTYDSLRNDPVEWEKYKESQRVRYAQHPNAKWLQMLKHLWTTYRIRLDDFLELFESQKGLCLGCDIKLVTFYIPEERDEYETDPNLIENVDYAIANIDHDYNLEKGDSNYVRGLLCPYCNHHTVDPLNPESRLYIYGVDGDLNKKEIIMNRNFLKQASEKGELKCQSNAL